MKKIAVLSLLIWVLAALQAWAVETPYPITLQSAATADGAGTAIIVKNYDIVGLDVGITNTATVTIQGRSSLGGTYQNIICKNRSTNDQTAVVSASANLQCAVAGLYDIKAPISSCSSCTVNVKGYMTTASGTDGGGIGGGAGGITIGPLAPYEIKRVNITTSSVNLAFGFTAKKIEINLPLTNTDEMCIDWTGGTAACPSANTAGNGRYPVGYSRVLEPTSFTSISVIAASGTQTIYVRAWR